MSAFFVTGIGTEIGKTVCSTVLTEALQADYWKPIQAGGLDATDSMFVQQYISNPVSQIHPERYRLNTPASPHYAAEIDGIEMQLSDFELPTTERFLLVEGAGGLLVPINRKETMLDLILHLNVPVILVSKNYLGSINHTLLTIECLKQAGVSIAGLVYSGEEYEPGESVIEQMTGVKTLCRVPLMKHINQDEIAQVASQLRDKLKDRLYEFER